MINLILFPIKLVKAIIIALLIKCSIKLTEHNLDGVAHWLFNMARGLAGKPPVHFCKWTVVYDNYNNIVGMRCASCNKYRDIY